MNKKMLITVFFFIFLSLFNNCKCPPERYVDYKSLIVMAEKTFVSQNDRLLLRIGFDEIEYLAKGASYVGLGGCAYATSVCEKGYDGEKYPIVKISVYSNSDFNDNYLAENELTNLIKVYGTNSNGEYILDFLNSFSIANINSGFLFIEERPTNSKKHTFTIKFEKSNGEIVSGISQEITWE